MIGYSTVIIRLFNLLTYNKMMTMMAHRRGSFFSPQQSNPLQLLFSCLLLALVFLSSNPTDCIMVSAILNVATPLNRHSNELEQFERYEALTNEDSGSDALWKKYLGKWNDCINKVSMNFRFATCREAIAAELANEASFTKNPLISSFVRNADASNAGRYLPDCKYSIDFAQASPHSYTDEYHSNYFIFTMKAHTCSSPDFLNRKKYAGGASFDVHASNVYHIVSCEVRDNFDDSYEVFCPLSKTLNTHHNSHMNSNEGKNHKVSNHHSHRNNRPEPCSCFALSVILDFEHYDAFNELGINIHRPLLNNILLDDDDICLCHNGSVALSSYNPNVVKELLTDAISTQISSSGGSSPASMAMGPPQDLNGGGGMYNLANRSAFASSWIRRLGEPTIPIPEHENAGLFSGKKQLIAANHSSNCKGERWGNFDYVWTGSGGTFPMKDKFKEYFTNRTMQVTELIGESHFRYTWDLYYYLYYGEDKLGTLTRKHGAIGVGSDIPALTFTEMVFSTDAADYILTKKCVPNSPGHENDPAQVIVVQSGSWDLSTSPLRNVVRNPNSIGHLLRAMVEWSQNNCSNDNYKNRLIYVSTQPTPRCAEDLVSCEGTKGYRNNYAIAALDQFVLKQLLLSRSEIIHFIDASKIIKPKIRFASSSCGLHFLCHFDGKVMQFSGPGVALAGEVLRCAMVRNPGHIDNINCLSLAQLAGSVDELHHIFLREIRHQTHSNIQFSHISDGTKELYYQIEGNIAREIEDKYTYDLIKDGTHHKAEVKSEAVHITDMKQLDNYPQMKTFIIPSRSVGKKYKANILSKNLPAYAINKEGLRTPLDATAASDAVPVRNEDLLDIQLFNECNSLV